MYADVCVYNSAQSRKLASNVMYRHMSYKVCVPISCWSTLLDVCIM